eukprot:Em0021g206a
MSCKKKSNNGSNLYTTEADQLNNGHRYHTSNRRQGPQCLNVVRNNLSEEDTSGSSDTDDANGTCEGCDCNTQLYYCDAYTCQVTHMFCSCCCGRQSCPVDGYPRKPGE